MSQPSERKCPLCGKPQCVPFRPFCSKRCADVDLAKWLGGRYAIPAERSRATDELASGEDDEGG